MIKFTFVLLCAMTFSVSTYGQNMNADLRKSFNKFSIVKINNQEALQKAKLRIPFNIQTDEKSFQFILRLNDIRSDDYKAMYTDNKGRHILPKGEIYTYKTTLIGESNSVVALTVDGTKTEGYIATEFEGFYEGFYMEAAKKYSNHATDEDKVIYQVKDKVKKDDGICGLDEAVASKMESVSSNAGFKTALGTQNLRRELEVTTEADKEFVQEALTGNGNPATANAHILSVMNQVDALYESQLNLSVVVTFQHAWMPNTVDPYAGLTNENLLVAFANYWNTNFPSSNPAYRRDVGHLFTNKIDSYDGLAYTVGTVCEPEISYSYTSSVRFDKWLATAHELAHNLGAYHTDQSPVQPSCVDTIMRGNQPTWGTSEFCEYSKNQIATYVNTNGDCLNIERLVKRRTMFDFDGDREADLSVFRPSNTYWYIEKSTAGYFTTPFGLATDKLAPADYDGDGKTDIAVFRPSNGTWYLQRSTAGSLTLGFGQSGDIPVPADFTDDGKAEVAVFRPSNSTWYTLDLTNNQTNIVQFGQTGDKPVVGDYDGDEQADYAVYRPQNGGWYLLKSTEGFTSIAFGNSTDKPVPADYDGDQRTDLAVYRNGTWHLQRSEFGLAVIPLGLSTDQPAPADYDKDGRSDVAVFRDGSWIRINSSTHITVTTPFGLSGDVAIPGFNIAP